MRRIWLTAIVLASAATGCNEGLPPGAGDVPAVVDAATAPPEDLTPPPPPPPPDMLDNGAFSPNYPAPFPDPPQVISLGGPVLKAPRFVPVYFSNNDMQLMAQVTDFLNRVGATNFWKATTSEYGVGPATATAPVFLAEQATGTIPDSMIQTWLLGKLNGNDPAWPAPDANTIYSLHYPAAVTITIPAQGGGVSKSCNGFGAYHGNVTLDVNHKRLPVAYAVIPLCKSQGMTGVDAITAPESHELVEAATDPYPNGRTAYAETDEAHLYWALTIGGGEVSDMCEANGSSYTKFQELPYAVQRSWSNAAILAGHDPCVPAPSSPPYFTAVPRLEDPIPWGAGLQQIDMMGVVVPVGESRMIELDLISDGDTGGPWTVSVRNQRTGGGAQTGPLSFTLDRDSGRNGEKIHLTITSVQATSTSIAPFVITSQLGNTRHTWYGLVGQ